MAALHPAPLLTEREKGTNHNSPDEAEAKLKEALAELERLKAEAAGK